MKRRKSSIRLLAVALVALLPCSSTIMAAPRAVCSSSTVDFGSVTDTNTITHTFRIQNAGDDNLILGRLRACCGATASLRDKQLSAGSNTVLIVKLSLRGRRGALNKRIYLATNDPQKPHLIFTLKGQVKRSQSTGQASAARTGRKKRFNPADQSRDIIVVPKVISLMRTEQQSKPVTRYVALRSRTQSPFRITGVELPLGAVVTSQKPLGKAGYRFEIENLVATPDLNAARIRFITDRENESSISIPIRVISSRSPRKRRATP